MELNRRNLFKFGLLTGAAATLPTWAQKVIPAPFRPEVEPLPPKGEEHWLPTVCRQCEAACGLLARVINGRACGIQGDPQHPISRGTLCPKGAASLQELYHPDRVRQPLQRVGQRGEGRWEPITWEAALKRVAERLNDVRSRQPAQLGLLLGPTAGGMSWLWHRFARAFGTPHVHELALPTGGLPEDAAALMMGAREGVTFDLNRAEFVLCFCDWLQCFPSPIEASRAYATLRRGRADRRVRIISIEPRLSVTAAKADEWVPIRPGAEGVLALGIAHVLIQKQLHDDAFVRERTQGFDEFKALVLRDYTPERVAKAADVSTEAVQRLAKEFAARKPALALCDRSSPFTQAAVLALNALVGSLGCPGGVRRKPNDNGLWSMVDGVPSSTMNHQPSPIDVLLLHHANPLFINPSRWREPLQRASFIVSITSFMDDTAQHADLVLPDHTPLEALNAAPTCTLSGSAVLSVSNPVVKPLDDTRHGGDVLIELARRLGEPVASRFPWESFEAAVKEAVKPLYEAKRGALLREVELEDEDWSSESKETFDQWFKKLCLAGGWADLSREGQPQPLALPTPSGKFEFRADKLTIKHKPSTLSHDLPLHLCLYVPLAFSGGHGAHLPALQGIAGACLGEQRWGTWVEIHPRTASSLGIKDGDAVVVKSSAGSIRARAKLFEGALPDVVNMPLGLGEGNGANPAALVQTDSTTGDPLWQQTRVRILKA